MSVAEHADKHQPNHRWVLIVSLNVVAGALLVTSNKVILLQNMPASSAALTFLHYFSTFIVLRVLSWKRRHDEPSRRVPIIRVVLLSFLATLSVATSNLTLKLSSVSFHQVSRLVSLPGGLLLDYFLYRKTRTCLETSYVAIVAVGVYHICFTDHTTTLLGCVFAVVSICATLCTALTIKATCAEYNLNAVNLAHLMSPWGTLSSLLWLITTLAAESGFNSQKMLGQKFWGQLSSNVVFTITIVTFNCFCAVFLNISSTWCAANCSTLMYAILGQGKILATISLSARVLHQDIPNNSILSLCISIAAFIIFIFLEQRSTQLQSHPLYLTPGGKFRHPPWAIISLFVLSGLLMSQRVLFTETYARNVETGQTAPPNTPSFKNHTNNVTVELRARKPAVQEIDFRVVAISARMEDSLSCGGCTALHLLVRELSMRGYHVETLVQYNQDVATIDCRVGNNTVVVFPEGFRASCDPLPKVQARWILAPMGAISSHTVTHAWPQTDWVYNYGLYAPGAKISVPDSNLLVVLRNPYAGDEFDQATYPKSVRSGKCYTIRKRDLFHKNNSITQMHDPKDALLPDSIKDSVHYFLTHEFFVSYDPYTYLTFAAAMLGCVSIVHPLGNLTKEQWMLSTAWGPYIRESGRETLLNGVAYGDSQDEINTARMHMHLVRQEFFNIKKWSEGTVDRFLSHVAEPNVNVDGKHTVSDFYPPGWNPGEFVAR